jgi:hypothetical protein
MLKHSFIKKYPQQVKSLFQGVTSWNDFNKNLHSTAESLKPWYKYKDTLGDGMEVFVEGLIKLTENDNRIGISNYEPYPIQNDYGLDGVGDNIIGEKSVVQIKYRIDPTVWLTRNNDNLGAFIEQGLILEDVTFTGEAPRHYIFTSAAGVARKTMEETWNNANIKVYGIGDIKKLIGGHTNFWNNFIKLI